MHGEAMQVQAAPPLIETLAVIQAEAARAVETLLVAQKAGDRRVSGISALRRIEIAARDRLEEDDPADSSSSGRSNGSTGSRFARQSTIAEAPVAGKK